MNNLAKEPIDTYRFLSGKHWVADPMQALFMSGPRRALFDALMAHQPERILDVCCGAGAMAARFTNRGIETTGVDASQTMLARAQAKGRLTNAVLMDVGQMEFTQEFDAAYINLAIHEMSPQLRERVWQNMCRAVRAGGVLAVIDLTPPPRHTRMARFWQGFFERDERSFLHTNPAHYANYREFMEGGGIRGWMQAMTKRPLASEQYFFAGNIGVLTTRV